MTLPFLTCWLYLAATTALVCWGAHSVAGHGRRLLTERFGAWVGPAQSTTRVVVAGFVLMNAGFASLTLGFEFEIEDGYELLRGLAWRLGLVAFALGGSHLVSAYLLDVIRVRRA